MLNISIERCCCMQTSTFHRTMTWLNWISSTCKFLVGDFYFHLNRPADHDAVHVHLLELLDSFYPEQVQKVLKYSSLVSSYPKTLRKLHHFQIIRHLETPENRLQLYTGFVMDSHIYEISVSFNSSSSTCSKCCCMFTSSSWALCHQLHWLLVDQRNLCTKFVFNLESPVLWYARKYRNYLCCTQCYVLRPHHPHSISTCNESQQLAIRAREIKH